MSPFCVPALHRRLNCARDRSESRYPRVATRAGSVFVDAADCVKHIARTGPANLTWIASRWLGRHTASKISLTDLPYNLRDYILGAHN